MSTLAIIIACLYGGYMAWQTFTGQDAKKSAGTNTDKNEQNFQVTGVELLPPSGSTLKVGEVISANIHYHYDNPDDDCYIWARLLNSPHKSGYQGSDNMTRPGKARTISRSLWLDEPGTINSIDILVKDMDFNQVHLQAIEVDYRYENNPALETIADDGIGACLTDIDVLAAMPCQLPASRPVNIRVGFEVQSQHGVNIWIKPNTDKAMTYQSSEGPVNGIGTIERYFMLTEAGQLDSLSIIIENQAGRVLLEQQLPVDIEFV